MKAWITDRWVKAAKVRMPDGSITKLEASPQQLQRINSLPEAFSSAHYGRGKRWQVTWRENGKIRARSHLQKRKLKRMLLN